MRRPGDPKHHKPAPGADQRPTSGAISRDGAGDDPETRLKREMYAHIAFVTGGLAPEDYVCAWWDWYLHVATAPKKRLDLAQSALEKAADTWKFAMHAAMGAPLPPKPDDPHFADSLWSEWPFNVYARTYGNWVSWWQDALRGVEGMPERSAQMMNFIGQQMIDATSPENFLHTNPELLEKTRAEAGQNLVRGFQYWLEDVQRMLGGRRAASPTSFKVGEQVAVTPGKVVLRNRLIELIQYVPQTSVVHPEPILIAPAWIMKYYILDLSPHNSLVRYLVEHGHTVFIISWKNPTTADCDLGLDDYVELGIREALNTVCSIAPAQKVHAVGYCNGGTLFSIAAASLIGNGDMRLATLSLFASLTDFSEPGELSVFITPNQLAMLEAIMCKQGVLTSERMAAAFAMLRARDLLWAPAVDAYVRGERPKQSDLMAWNADGTRMPRRMHGEFLGRLYLKNELARGKFSVQGQGVDLGCLQLPMFVVGTETDHIAPWRSVYKVRELTHSADYTFLLTSGGHNAGIVSGPKHSKRQYRTLTWSNSTETLLPEQWIQNTTCETGSWWPVWQRWLVRHSSPKNAKPPAMGNAAAAHPPLEDAPGRYVHE